jgi:hypothetical protein
MVGQFDAGAEQPAADNRLTAIVAAYAHAADAALAQIVAHVDDSLAKVSEARYAGSLRETILPIDGAGFLGGL